MNATADSMLPDPRRIIVDLQRQLAECRAERDSALAERDEALEQQTATAEVLQVINSSKGELAPVFDAILEKAHNLCSVTCGTLQLYDGETFHAVATRGYSEAFADRIRRGYRASGRSVIRPLLDGAQFLQIPDWAAFDDPISQAGVELEGVHTALFVPLRRDDTFLGMISASRREIRPFTDREIALLENFAAQAVIAMENARLLTETREALEQQTAAAEVLQVINSSPGDLARVFDAMLEKATRICQADSGFIFRLQDGLNRMVAAFGVPAEYKQFQRLNPILLDRGTLAGRTALERRVVHIVDAAADPKYTRAEAVQIGGQRTMLGVPLIRENALIGVITFGRSRVEPFTERQIALVRTFADQAVIAIENTRLITETREALEQQTATAEVLQVINSSPGDLTPVFNAILDKALDLCQAAFGTLWTFDGECFDAVALRRVPAGFAGVLTQAPYRPEPGSGHERLLRGAPYVQIDDAAAGANIGPVRRALVELGGARTVTAVPLLKDGAVLGAISAFRQEVRPFTEKQIALLQNFAAQAVIAMENARLITETREALEQQTATAEVLQVINSSPGDLGPVFDAVLNRSMRLCGVDHAALELYDGERMHAVAVRGASDKFAEMLRQGYPATDSPASRTLLEGGSFVEIADAAQVDHVAFRTAAAVDGIRTVLFVPLRRDEVFLGMIASARRDVRPYSDKEIALLQNFAAQAVIAMENARLLTETREALEQQTATAEILEVINRSPGNLGPVYEVLLEKAHNLCGVGRGTLQLYDGAYLRVVAAHAPDVPNAFVDRLRQGYRASDYPLSRPLLDGARFVHIADLAEIDDPLAQTFVELAGTRSVLFIPLRREGALLGVIASARQEVRPFSEKEIALLENFAGQAVIAMDNARLLNEIRQRQAELRVTFDNMGDGVAMFDAELRLAAWNLNFQRILDLPGELLAERLAYADYIRFLARRGEYGTADTEAELRRRLEGLSQESRFEHTRPDSRIIEVRRNAVPGGGFVVIYSDVTERKRAEAEIRTARDTAERALQELQTTQASLVHAQKMAALGQLTAGIAHEIKNPLNFVNNFAGLSVELLDELKETAAPAITALDDEKRAEIDETIEMLTGNLEKIAEHGRRADNIVKSMLEHSRGASGERRSVDLNALIDEALNLAYHGGRAQDQSFSIMLERDYAQPIPPIELVPQDITRVCLNLFANGFYATTKRQREGGDASFKPTLKVSTRDLGDAVEVRIRDNGNGIPAEIKDKLFQPFFTTKPTGEGAGLGLSISYDIVTQQHGGTIEVDSRVGEFTEFIVRLPRTHHTTMAEAAS